MKWSQLSPQKKLYAFCGLLLIVVVVFVTDHVVLRAETARLKRAIGIAPAITRDRLDVSGDIERNVKSLDSEIDALKYRLDDLESKMRSFRDLDRQVSHLEMVVSRLDNKVEGAVDSPATSIRLLEGEVQALQRKIDQHGKYLREIMGKIGMWLPADLLGR